MRKRKTLLLQRISIPALLSFFASLLLCGLIMSAIITNKVHLDRLRMEQLVMEKSIKLTEVIHKLLYKTEALSALVIQSDGKVGNFERVASTLVDDPAISNVLIAPAGIVSHVYPLRGNEHVLGFNFFQNRDGNIEARMAKATGQLVFGGPFTQVQGGQALVGRLPVYMDGPGGDKHFWGLVSVSLRYPQVLDGVGLPLLEKQGYAFEIYRTNPDTGMRQIIAGSDYAYDKSARFIEKSMEILNATWYFRISPVKLWYWYTETWILLFIGLLVSGLAAFVVQNNHELKRMQERLEEMAQIDALTAIANRRHFMATAPALLSQAARNRQRCFIIMLDVDHFKNINDSYGHAAGDEALKCIAMRIKKTLRPYDLLARYGGEEFIILVVGVEQETAEKLSARVRLSICESPIMVDDTPIQISASFGLAPVESESGLEESIRHADSALYKAKKAGRNRSVSYSPSGEGPSGGLPSGEALPPRTPPPGA